MFDYAGLRASVAEPLIKDFGKDGVLKIPVTATGNKPWGRDTGDPIEIAAIVVQTRFTFHERSNTLVQNDDTKYLVSTEGMSVDPALADRLEVDGTTYRIVEIKPLRPGPLTMLWTVHCRK